MRYCTSEECSGLDPCPACASIRRAVLMRAVQEAGLTKEQAEKFFRAYAEHFDHALEEVRKLAEEAGKKRLEEKAARDKLLSRVGSKEEKEGRKSTGAGATTGKVTPLKKKVAEEAQANAAAAAANDANNQHSAPQVKE